MDGKGMVTSVVLFVVMGLVIAGCAAGKYATIKPEDSGRVTLDTLVRDWQNYNVYYGGMNPDRAIAVIFEPKSDEKNIEVEGRWWKATDEKTIRNAIARIKMLQETAPRLWKILGPDDSLYGCAYTPLLRLNNVVVDDNTIRMVTF